MGSPKSSRRTPTAADPTASLLQQGSRALSAVALVNFLLVLWTLIARSPLPGESGWPEALLVLTATLATLAALGRILPGQNVLLVACIIGLLGSLAHGLGAATAFPFGPFVYSAASGPLFFNTLAWYMPLLWITAILNARGVARLILRPWRKLRSYGGWLIGVTAVLVVLFDLTLEPYAAHLNHFWLWLPTKFPLAWYGAPLVNSLGWLISSLLILAFATPALSKKASRSRKTPADYQPLIVWLLALTLFAIGAFQNQLWPAFTLCLLTGFTTAILAIRGARW